jgi:hypothetical protein
MNKLKRIFMFADPYKVAFVLAVIKRDHRFSQKWKKNWMVGFLTGFLVFCFHPEQ